MHGKRYHKQISSGSMGETICSICSKGLISITHKYLYKYVRIRQRSHRKIRKDHG